MEGYQGIKVALYDAFASKKAGDDVRFYIEEAQKSGSPVLEVGCGTGRILIPLAEAGVRVTGLEKSPEMLEVAKGKVAQLGHETKNRIELVEGDMCDFSLHEQYSLIVVPNRAFQHVLTPEDQRRALTCIVMLQMELEFSWV